VGCRILNREVEEPRVFRAEGKRRSWKRQSCSEGCDWRQFGIRAGSSFLSEAEKRNLLCCPEEKGSHQIPKTGRLRRRGRPGGNLEMERQMRDLRARLEEMEIAQRREVGAGDLSDSEVEEEAGHVEEVTVEDASTERLIKAIGRMGAKAKMDIPVYEGNLDAEELLDWIGALDTYFDYEDIEEDKKVKHAITHLKGHATLWWDELQADRRCKGKKNIKSWERMIAKIKAKFIPRDYQITLFRRMQNLRQKLMTVKEYTEEFYRLNIRAGHRKSNDEKVSRYLNGLRYDIQDELSMLTIQTVEDAYQLALKAEEKLSCKQG
jgi:hypothetical protein